MHLKAQLKILPAKIGRYDVIVTGYDVILKFLQLCLGLFQGQNNNRHQ